MSERVLFARVGMMSYYRGPQAGDERPVGGGRYNRTNIGHEAWNFDLRDGWYYGYVRSGSRDEGVRLDRIDAATAHSDELDGVTIIFFAPKAGGGQVVVGWYRRAIVYRAAQREKTGSPPSERLWCCKAKASDAWLLPQSYRTREVPRGKGATGQSNITYAHDLTWAGELLDYVRDYDGPNLCREWLAEAEDQAAVAFEVAAAAREGQSFGGTPEQRQAVEVCAMRAAERFYRDRGYECDPSAHKTKPYDLLCTKGGETRYVEVKGTRGGPRASIAYPRRRGDWRSTPHPGWRVGYLAARSALWSQRCTAGSPFTARSCRTPGAAVNYAGRRRNRATLVLVHTFMWFTTVQAVMCVGVAAAAPKIQAGSGGCGWAASHGLNWEALIPILALAWTVALCGLTATLLASIWNDAARTHRRTVAGQCLGCGYLLHGLPEPRCPECGRPVERESAT